MFDGPRLIRPDELRASRRLFQLCFGGLDLAKENSEALEVAGSAEEAPEAAPDSWYETCVISANGAPVSQIIILYKQLQILGCRVRAGSIGGVCTHPDQRGLGLASQLLEYCARRLAENGARIMLISGGRGLYTRLGCVPMGRFAAFSIQPEPALPIARAAAPLRLRSAEPADAARCAQLYRQESVHFERRERAFSGRFEPHPIGFEAEEIIAERDGRAAAYLILCVPWHYVRQPGAAMRQVAEYAGDRAAVRQAILFAAQELKLRELQAPIPWQDGELIGLLRESGTPQSWSGLPGHTIRLIDFRGLMSDLRPHILARLSPDLRGGLRFTQAGPPLAGGGSDVFSIVRGKDRLNLDGAAMTGLVMGTPDVPARAVASPPAIAEIVSALFPLPSFFTGLDYH